MDPKFGVLCFLNQGRGGNCCWTLQRCIFKYSTGVYYDSTWTFLASVVAFWELFTFPPIARWTCQFFILLSGCQYAQSLSESVSCIPGHVQHLWRLVVRILLQQVLLDHRSSKQREWAISHHVSGPFLSHAANCWRSLQLLSFQKCLLLQPA